MTYSKDNLRQIFQQPFSMSEFYTMSLCLNTVMIWGRVALAMVKS